MKRTAEALKRICAPGAASRPSHEHCAATTAFDKELMMSSTFAVAQRRGGDPLVPLVRPALESHEDFLGVVIHFDDFRLEPAHRSIEMRGHSSIADQVFCESRASIVSPFSSVCHGFFGATESIGHRAVTDKFAHSIRAKQRHLVQSLCQALSAPPSPRRQWRTRDLAASTAQHSNQRAQCRSESAGRTLSSSRLSARHWLLTSRTHSRISTVGGADLLDSVPFVLEGDAPGVDASDATLLTEFVEDDFSLADAGLALSSLAFSLSLSLSLPLSDLSSAFFASAFACVMRCAATAKISESSVCDDSSCRTSEPGAVCCENTKQALQEARVEQQKN